MTDKQSFLEKLRAALLDRDIQEVDIQPYIERFDRFYDRMVNDPETGRSDILDDIDSIADNIASQVSERYDEINRLAERTMTVDRVRTDEPPLSSKEPTSGASDNPENVSAAQTPALSANSPGNPPGNHPGNPPGNPTGTPAESGILPANGGTESPPVPSDAAPPAKHRLPDYVDAEPAPNSTIFWVLFAVSLPLTIPLGLCVLALFLAVWGGLAAMIVGSIALLIGVAAGGTALALVGIIYGITQLFSVVPVGIYEIGLGVLIGGCVMFAGILLYNFAVRLLPVVIKQVAKLFRYLYGQFKVLFAFLRRECAKL